jgi:hypothetical protein
MPKNESNKTGRLQRALLSVKSAYLPYLSAITTFLGAVLLTVGFIPSLEGIRLIGGVIAAVGAFWSAHRQVKAASENRKRDQKIISLSEQLQSHLTGGDSFCYGYPTFDGPGVFRWLFIQSGQYVLSDVHVRISNLGSSNIRGLLGRSFKLGTMFPGKVLPFEAQEVRLSSHGYNLFFIARNGSWTQEIRWTELPGVLAVANRVIRDGMPLDQPLLFEVSPQSPVAPANEAWNDPPPYTPTTSAPKS